MTPWAYVLAIATAVGGYFAGDLHRSRALERDTQRVAAREHQMERLEEVRPLLVARESIGDAGEVVLIQVPSLALPGSHLFTHRCLIVRDTEIGSIKVECFSN